MSDAANGGDPVKGLAPADDRLAATARLHFRLGWWSLLVFVLLGITLEAMHAFKVAWFVNSGDAETTRLLWRLGHAHGTFLSLVHMVFAVTVLRLPGWSDRVRGLASRSLLAAAVLIPAGFFLGGVPPFVESTTPLTGRVGGDPGLGILALPLGAVLLVYSIAATAMASRRHLR